MSILIPLFQPIKTVNAAGRHVLIQAINTASTDCIHGVTTNKDGSECQTNWDLSGIARDREPSYNIDLRREELMYLRETILKILPDEIKKFIG
jgi:hypothetical protein